MKNTIQKGIGLMFHTRTDKAYIFPYPKPRKIRLHMLFVFFPLDIIFLDANGKVLEIKKNLAPFTFYTSKKQAQTFLELPAGTLSRTRTQIGDQMKLQ